MGWKHKTTAIMTASQRAEVLVQTHSISNITWEKNSKPIQTQKTSLSFKLSESLNLSLIGTSCWNPGFCLSAPLTAARKKKKPSSSIFSKHQFPFHPNAGHWAEITPIHCFHTAASSPVSVQPWECSLPISWYCCRARRKSIQTGSVRENENYLSSIKMSKIIFLPSND